MINRRTDKVFSQGGTINIYTGKISLKTKKVPKNIWWADGSCLAFDKNTFLKVKGLEEEKKVTELLNQLLDEEKKNIIKKNKSNKKTFTKKHYNSGDGMMTRIWGPMCWTFLHTMSFNYPVNPTSEDKKHYKDYAQKQMTQY